MKILQPRQTPILRNNPYFRYFSHLPLAVAGTEWSFDPASVTFTAGLAKRTAPKVFTTAPMMQGTFDTGSTVGDQVEYSRGSQVDGNFYDNMDGSQGTVVLWWTPEFTDTGNNQTLFNIGSGGHWARYEPADNRIQWNTDNGYLNASLTTVAGTTYCIIFRWDVNNTLDGTNYCCITIDDTHTYGITSVSAIAPRTTQHFGNLNNDENPANGIIEGFTVYRRVLTDGTNGIDVGESDELAAIYASGSGKDPCEITGSWDVCFCLPTDQDAEVLGTTLEAWSHPHSSNLLADGFMLDGTYSNSWNDEGTPTSVGALSTAESVFGAGGYKWTNDAANEGIYQDETVTAGDDFVIRVLAYSDGTAVPKVILYDQTNTAEIGSLTGSTSSTRTALDVFIFTGRAPSGCTTLRVKLISTASSGTVYFLQCELLTNYLGNPSMAEWQGSTPDIPTDWTNVGLDAGESIKETTTVHSGTYSFGFDPSAGMSSPEFIRQSMSGFTNGGYCVFGGWTYGDGDEGPNIGSQFHNQTVRQTLVEGTSSGHVHPDVNRTAAWGHCVAVHRSLETTPNFGTRHNGNPETSTFVDDCYSFLLDDVTLTVTPATEANSSEDSGIRVDGTDDCNDSLDTITATAGTIKWAAIPRHAAADVAKFGNSTPYIIHATGDADDYIKVYWSAANTITLLYQSSGGGEQSDTWDATGAISADTTYQMHVIWTSTEMKLSVGGTDRITITQTVNFGTVPSTIYMGSDSAGANQWDAVFLAPT